MGRGLRAFIFSTRSHDDIPQQMAPSPRRAGDVTQHMRKTNKQCSLEGGTSETGDKNGLAKCQDVVCSTLRDDQALFQVATPCPPPLINEGRADAVGMEGSEVESAAPPQHYDGLYFFVFASAMSGCVPACVCVCACFMSGGVPPFFAYLCVSHSLPLP